MSDSSNTIETFANQEYKWGFVTDIESESIPRGLSEDVVRLISAKKNEPQFMLDWRLRAYRHWASLQAKEAEPKWANIHYSPIDYQAITYYSAPKQKPQLESLDQLDRNSKNLAESVEELGKALPVLDRVTQVCEPVTDLGKR